MGNLYHGSSKSGLSKLEPKKSTHGTYVYATPYKELAIIFSGRCGDDLTYSLFRDNKTEPWKVVERIPKGFEIMFNNEASLYTLDDSTFKDIKTGFAEVVSEVPVEVKEEEHIKSVFEAIKSLENEGLVELYYYPNRPKDIPRDDSDLIEKEIKQCQRENESITKNTFKRLLYLHPDLMEKVNEKLNNLNLELYTKNDLINNFEEYVMRQKIDLSHEQYVDSAIISITKTFPELSSHFQDKIEAKTGHFQR